MKTNHILPKRWRNLIKAIATVCMLACSASVGYAQSWDEVTKLVSQDGELHDAFGYTVAISGDYAIVGTYNEDHDASGGNYLSHAGSAYIFKNITGTWTQVQKIVASDRATGDLFGTAVAIAGDYAIVGADREDHDSSGVNTLNDAGAAYIFQNIAGTWLQVTKIVASDREAYDEFGSSVAISEEYAIVGAPLEDHNTVGGISLSNAGSAYIFKNDGGVWVQVQKIVAPDRGVEDMFGNSVAISGEYAVVTAHLEDQEAISGNYLENAGSAYIFLNYGGSWLTVQKIVAVNRGDGDQFGISSAISDEYLIIGAYGEAEDAAEGNTVKGSGAAYVFRNNNGSWSHFQKLVASERAVGDQFGYSVAITGIFAVVGAHFEDQDESGINTIDEAGSVYVFRNHENSWSQVQKIVPSTRRTHDVFGHAVAISENYILVACPGQDASALNVWSNEGAVFAFYNGSASNELIENSFRNDLVIYPNPTDGKFSIDLGAIYQNAEIKITDLTGKLITSKTINQSQVLNFTINEPAGIYLMSIQADDKIAVIRLVKE